MENLFYILIISYIIGAIPIGYIIGKIFYHIDIRLLGSENIGSSNVYRTLGIVPGIITQFIDIFKGIFCVGFLSTFLNDITFSHQIIIGCVVVYGQIHSIFLNGNGGKGVNTFFGAFLILFPYYIIGALGIFLIILSYSKYISLSSIIGIIVFLLILIISYLINNMNINNIAILTLIYIVIDIIFAHQNNIIEILNKTENKIKFLEKK